MRYAGQNYELEVAAARGPVDAGGWDALLARFEREHEAQLRLRAARRAVELIDCA